MGNGWSETSSNDCSIASDSSSESGESVSSIKDVESIESPVEIITEQKKLEKEPQKVAVVEGEQKNEPNEKSPTESLPPMTPEMIMLERIRKATAARDERERRIVATMNLYTTLQSEVYQMNYDLILANQQFALLYGKNAMDELKKYEVNESSA